MTSFVKLKHNKKIIKLQLKETCPAIYKKKHIKQINGKKKK
jgi:hypothetical protein